MAARALACALGAALSVAAGATAQGAVSLTGPVITYESLAGQPYSLTYDNRSLFVAPQGGAPTRTLFFSFGMHYPRATRGMWYDLLMKAKTDGYNMVQTYVFWNSHVHKPGQFDFDGGFAQWYNLTAFLETAAEVGLFVNLRIGPYVCAEWNMGGYPLWLRGVPGLVDRSSSTAWEAAMSDWFSKIIGAVRPFFADRGGPIALAQVENELHTGDNAYVEYCGQLAAQYPYGIQWEMCNGNSAANTINSCNGGSCTGFIESYGQNGLVLKTQPAMWTEDWIGWYQQWTDGGSANINGGDVGMATGKSYGYLQWVARGGTHHNFYMAFGGNNFRRMQGAGTMPWYYVDAVLNSDGLANDPVRTHMKNLQAALSTVGTALLSNPAQVHQQVNVSWAAPGDASWSITGKQYAFLYGGVGTANSAVFLENAGSGGVISFNGKNYSSNGNSVLVLGPDGSILFDSSRPAPSLNSRVWTPLSNTSFAWQSWSEAPTMTVAGGAAGSAVALASALAPARAKWSSSSTAVGSVWTNPTPYEQLNMTEDDTEHTYYSAQVQQATLQAVLEDAEARALAAGLSRAAATTTLTVTSAKSNALSVYLAGKLASIGYELSEDAGTYVFNLTLSTAHIRAALEESVGATATVSLTIHSESMGIHKFSSINNGPDPASFHTTAIKGITSSGRGAVVLGGQDITAIGWTMTAGLAGEALQVYTPAGGAKVTWTAPGAAVPGPLTWYRTTFTAPPLSTLMRTSSADPEVTAAVHLDSTGLSRAHFYVNGLEVSRVWTKQCGGGPCQRYYFVPPDILLPGDNANTLVIFDAEGPTDLTRPRMVLSHLQAPMPCTSTPVAGQNLTLSQCQGTPGLLWDFVPCHGSSVSGAGQFTLRRPVPGGPLCMAAFGANPSTGAPNIGLQTCVASSACAATPAQLFVAGPAGHTASILQAGSGQCLDLPNQDMSIGTRVETWGCNGGGNQLFSYDAQSGNIYGAGNDGLCTGVC